MRSPSDAIRALVDRLPEQELRRPGGRTHGNWIRRSQAAERRASANAARGRQAGPRSSHQSQRHPPWQRTRVSAKRLWRASEKLEPGKPWAANYA